MGSDNAASVNFPALVDGLARIDAQLREQRADRELRQVGVGRVEPLIDLDAQRPQALDDPLVLPVGYLAHARVLSMVVLTCKTLP